MSTNPSPDDAALEAELKVVEALADKAMAPWNAGLSAEDRAWMREMLIEVLATHPNAQRLIAQLATPPVVEVSGEVGDDAALPALGKGQGQDQSGGTK